MKHKGLNDTESPIYLVEVVYITGTRRSMYGIESTFSTQGTSYDSIDAATLAYADAPEPDGVKVLSRDLKIKRPGSRNFLRYSA